MWFNSSSEEYTTKVDGYFYDKKTNMMKIILKIRNKRTTLIILVKDILKNREVLSTLHPIDLCIIGVLANDKKMGKADSFKSIPDNYLMIKIKPLIEIVGREFIEDKEVLHLKIKGINKKTTVTAQELFNDKKLMSALEYHDALSIGFSIASSEEHLTIENYDETLNILICAQQGVWLILIIISFLLSGTSLLIHLFGAIFNLTGEVLVLPVLLSLQIENLKKIPTDINNKFLIGSILILIMFFMYFSWITSLPYPLIDQQTPFFNQFFTSLKDQSLCYILAFYFMNIIINQTYKIADTFLKMFCSEVNSELAIKFLAILLFFLNVEIGSYVLNVNSSSPSDFFYVIFLTFIFHMFKIIKNNFPASFSKKIP